VSHLGHRLSAFIDGELSHQQRERVLAHLANCEPCRREAAALRMLKQRMHALGEATADTALTDRLIAVAGVAGPAPWGRRLPWLGRRMPGTRRRRWQVRSLLAGLAMVGLGVPAAAFLAGGGQPEAGPSVTPAVPMFMLQHEFSTGQVPAQTATPSGLPSPSVRHTVPAWAVAAATPHAITSGLGVLSAAGAAASVRAAAALVRVAAASSRVVAASPTGKAAAGGRPRRPHPVRTAAGAG
jgi:anti-sigma factor RsiW